MRKQNQLLKIIVIFWCGQQCKQLNIKLHQYKEKIETDTMKFEEHNIKYESQNIKTENPQTQTPNHSNVLKKAD